MITLGIQKHHLSSVCLLENNKIIYFNQEERLSRIKKDSGFPLNCIKEIVKLNITIDKLVITGYDSYKSEDISIISLLKKLGVKFSRKFSYHYNNRNHHLAHAANAFYNSGMKDAVIVVWDGKGSCYSLNNGYSAYETTTVFLANYPNNFTAIYKRFYTPRKIDDDTTIIWDNGFGASKENWPIWQTKNATIEIRNDYDIGLQYEAMSRSLGFDDEGGKMLGLSAYGKDDDYFKPFINEQGIFDMSSHYFDANFNHRHFAWGKYSEAMNNQEKLSNLAYITQKNLETQGLNFLKKILKKSGRNNLILTGGVSLNVVANNYYKKNLPDINMYVEPTCGDEANCIGMARYYHYENCGSKEANKLENVYLCGAEPTYNYKIQDGEFEYKNVDEATVAEVIRSGSVVALFQGKAESGPRALGNRSLLCDPRLTNGKELLNVVKGREEFRPFAASILEEEANKWFELRGLESSPFMMFALDAKDNAKEQVPAVVHVNGTCRIQTVNQNQNIVFYNLISEFYKKTGIPMLMNTSFNLSHEPIIETVEGAFESCRNSGINYLYMPDIKTLVYFK